MLLLCNIAPLKWQANPTRSHWLSWRARRDADVGLAKQLHLHQLNNDRPTLKQRVASLLDRLAQSSPELLRYTGLLHN